jgi:hypothetical protein
MAHVMQHSIHSYNMILYSIQDFNIILLLKKSMLVISCLVGSLGRSFTSQSKSLFQAEDDPGVSGSVCRTLLLQFWMMRLYEVISNREET